MVLHHEFFNQASRLGKKIAVEDTTTGMVLSYRRMAIAVNYVASKLAQSEESYTGILLPTSGGCLIASMAAIMSKKPPVMINYSTGAGENIEYARKKCGFRTVLTSKTLLKKIKLESDDNMIFLEDLMKEMTLGDKLKSALFSFLPASLQRNIWPGNSDDEAVILFTSGSEKDPKAVVLTHNGLGSNVAALRDRYDLGDRDSMMSVLPLFHVFGFNGNFLLPLLTGMTTYTAANPLDYKRVAALLRDKPVTMAAATPAFWRGYLRESEPGDWDSLRILATGADKTPSDLERAVLEKHGKRLLEGYGATETSPTISCNTSLHYRSGSIGRVLPCWEIKIADDEFKPLPSGTQGQIMVKGPGLMKGYLNDEKETQTRIIDGWYATGDLGILDDDGYLWHKGRIRRFCKIGGEMISLVSVEESLQEVLPEGVACCVVDVPDKRKGARIVAAVTSKIKTIDVIRDLRRRLPSIALPKEFCVIPELPKMGSGKIAFREIETLVRSRLGA